MKWALAVAPLLVLAALALYSPGEDTATTYLEKSIPHIGVNFSSGGPDGEGILIAVVDTGINYSHPDLLGFGPDGKVVGGHNFIDPSQPPLDTNGHGTQVAGVIAADGDVRGVAPAARLLAYKVSEDGEGVSPDLIVAALRMAVEAGADIVNISLGVNKTNDRIDAAVSEAAKRGVLVVAAAGNDGPVSESIGSPGRNPLALTVGATYNNLTSSQVATLTVNEMPFVVIPMLDSAVPAEPIDAPVVFAGYARERDLSEINATGAVVLAERGSDTMGEMLYFSIKESNAADAGAAAIIVFNNEDGIFHGELIHEFNEPGYVPRIPAVSMSREDGLAILEMTQEGARAALNFLLDPDHPVPFSSRGPVSPFYAKPDIMAPGVYINTTTLSGHGTVSGTSYATPHVSGAAALLMQQNPGLSPEDIRSILVSTSAAVTEQTGMRASLHNAGSGRLNVTAALSAEMVVQPPVVVASVTSTTPWTTVSVDLRPLAGSLGDVSVEHDVPGANVFHSVSDGTLLLYLGSNKTAEGHLEVTYQDTPYTIPILLQHTEGTVTATQDDGRLWLGVSHPDGWSFAKITVTGRGGEEYRISAVPDRPAYVDVYENGLYYVQADIVTGSRGTAAYDTILVDTVTPGAAPPQGIPDIPWRQVAIAVAIAGVVGVAARVMPAGRRPLYPAGRR